MNNDTDTIIRRAAALQRGGRLREAVRLYEQVLEQQPGNAQILHVAGVACTQLKDYHRAIGFLRQAMQIGPSSEIANSLGLALFPFGEREQAIACFGQALAANPANAKAANNLGNACLQMRDLERARTAFETAVRIKPDYIEARSNFGHCLVVTGDPERAIREFKTALRQDPKYRHAIEGLISAYRVLDRYEEIVAERRKLLALDSKNTALLVELGAALQEIDRHDDAIDCFNEALEIDAGFAPAHARIGRARMEEGRLEEARESLAKACALEPDSCSHRNALIGLARVSPGDGTTTWLEKKLSRRHDLPPGEQVSLHFACGKAFADLGEHERSFEHYLEGNKINRALVNYDEKTTLEKLDRSSAVFSSAVVRSVARTGNLSPTPIFILGMPRTGSTLVEQILSAHPAVVAAGELAAFRDIVQSVAAQKGQPYPDFLPSLGGDDLLAIGNTYIERLNRVVRARAPLADMSQVLRVTDKMPGNFMFLGLIHSALPNAKLIHTRRDPIETCLSCFRVHFDWLRYTSDLGELGRYYRHYDALMGAWRSILPAGLVLDVHYEQVVQNFEYEARRIVAHCGLPWDDACLSFEGVDRPVKTASIAQVRRPLYKTSLKPWRPNSDALKPLLDGLGESAVRNG